MNYSIKVSLVKKHEMLFHEEETFTLMNQLLPLPV